MDKKRHHHDVHDRYKRNEFLSYLKQYTDNKDYSILTKQNDSTLITLYELILSIAQATHSQPDSNIDSKIKSSLNRVTARLYEIEHKNTKQKY